MMCDGWTKGVDFLYCYDMMRMSGWVGGWVGMNFTYGRHRRGWDFFFPPFYKNRLSSSFALS